MRDAKTGAMVSAMSADMRGNTDELWARALDWLLRNRLLAPNYGARPMTLFLASVTGPEEAEIAVAHGADIIDLKDSARGRVRRSRAGGGARDRRAASPAAGRSAR